ncbi:MAG: 50S ribosomal protein L17 [Deltaproteobacteria bacterium]|nr:50S ribosomal protein L17 [Deltaproteobacteria bacterium]MBI3076547.1 50S ribosomal protein L17 [Deltaproteobacteria bacterium]
MRHLKMRGQLGRPTAHRLAMLRNLVTSFLEHERVTTTHAKARELRRLAERMITLGKAGTLHARRRALRVIRDQAVAKKLFDTLAPRFRERSGGYTRIVKVGPRPGDGAPMSVVELLPEAGGKRERAPKRAKRTRPKAEGGKAPGRRAGKGKAPAGGGRAANA